MAISEQMLDSVTGGILPLTSACNTACTFCSHRFNPAEIRTVAVEPLAQSELQELLPTIARLHSLTIGEAASTIMEGEPLTHPDFCQVMQQIRDAAPHLAIKLTTNGILLTDELLAFLEIMQPIELTISLNSCTEQGRQKLMGVRAGSADTLLKRLAGCGLAWHASLVAMPHLVGLDDVMLTLQAAADHGARTIRVFLPGFTRLTPEALRLPDDVYQDLLKVLDAWADAHLTPLLVEPRKLTDLQAEVAGVVRGTPAEGRLSRHDVIRAVDGANVRSRMDAFDRLYTSKNPEVEFSRDGRTMLTQLHKPAASRSGIVMSGDLPPSVIQRLRRHCSKRSSVWVLVSNLGEGLIRACLPQAEFPGVKIIVVSNRTFGGSIACAGLLTVADLISSLPVNEGKPDLLLLPKVAFDQSGYDIAGVHYQSVHAAAGCRVVLL